MLSIAILGLTGSLKGQSSISVLDPAGCSVALSGSVFAGLPVLDLTSKPTSASSILVDEEYCESGCGNGQQASMLIWRYFGTFPPQLSKTVWASKWRQAIRKLNRSGKGIFGKAPGTDHTDEISGNGIHILVYPPAYLKSKRFMIKKTNLSVRSDATYTICTSGSAGRQQEVFQLSVPANDPSATRFVDVPNSRGKATIVIIQNHSGNGSSLSYQVRDVTVGN